MATANATAPAPDFTSTKHISRALWEIAIRFSGDRDIGLTGISYLDKLREQGVHISQWANMRNDPARQSRRVMGDESMDWYTDADLAKQIKNDPEKGKMLRKIYAYVEASVPEMFRPGVAATKFAPIAKKIAQEHQVHAEKNLMITFGGLWHERNDNPERPQSSSAAIMAAHMWPYHHVWNAVLELKETLKQIDPELLDLKKLDRADQVRIESIKKAANEPFQDLEKKR